MSTSELKQSDAMVIVSTLLQDFFDNNKAETIATSGKIVKTLLQNAIKQTDDPKKQEMYRKIRLTNPKIKQHVVQVAGALDILGVAGFVQAGEFLNYTPATRNALELYLEDDMSSSQEHALVEAICSGLQAKLQELEPNNKKSTTGTAAAASSSTTTTTSDPFLTAEERAKRVKKIKAQKKNQKAQREEAVARWNEMMEDKKEKALRREAALNAQVQADAQDGLAANITIGSSHKTAGGMLAKPFEGNPRDQLAAAARARAQRAKEDNAAPAASKDPQAIRRRLIQETMKDSQLTPKEKQTKVQELMKMGTEGLLAAAASVVPSQETEMVLDGPAMAAPPPADKEEEDKDDKMEEEEDQKPAAKTTTTTESPLPEVSDDLLTSRAPKPPSAEWTRFIEHTPRCAPAEGIRDSSVFYGKLGASDNMAIPRCLKRLFKELDGLKDALPADPNCSIWLRFDEETPQFIRALVAAPLPGPTPYSGGVFAFDIYVPNEYPKTNPKVQLLTTGGGNVRFGPNLYADGKVCLSLLGTWEGPKWNPKHSSLYQVLISIQGLLLGVEHPYYLEPGHGGWEGKVKDGAFTVKGQSLSGKTLQQEVGVPMKVILYEDELRVGAVKFAMHQHLRWALEGSKNTNGLETFSDIIQAHFWENRSSVLAEVRTWMSDVALGRNRDHGDMRKAGYKLGDGNNKTSKKAMRIDDLQALLPKLEALLDKNCMPATTASAPKKPPPAAAQPSLPPQVDPMDTEEEQDSKPAARAPSPSGKRDKEEEQASTDAKRNKTDTQPPSEVDVVEQKRQQMQEAASKGDYVLAGRLQEEVKRLEELQRGMQEAAQQNDFIRAGRLQAQFKALTATTAASANKTTQSTSTSAWNDDDNNNDGDASMDDEEDIDSGDDMDSDEEMGGPPFAFGGTGSTSNFPLHGLGKNVFAPPGHKYHPNMSSKHHGWGTGSQLGNTTAPVAAAAAKTTTTTVEEPAKKVAPKKSIPPDQLCRLRIRLPNNKSVVEDFEKNDSLSVVYRRLEPQVPEEKSKKSPAVGLAAVGGGAFSQPLSSAGFTLLLTRPKREFSLEMHGTKSLLDLNLAPSATLTVMKCSDRGIVYRGEVESRLQGAQGDAMDVDGLTYEGLVELTERVGKAGPREGSAFLTLTTEQFEANTEKISPASYLASLDENMEEAGEDERCCPICVGSYDATDTTPSLRKVKGCGHLMHGGCLSTWLQTSSTCPLCKSSLA